MTPPIEMEYRKVGTAALELGGGAAFRFRWTLPGEEENGPADASLVESVGSIGVISPPVLADRGDSLEVVSGFRRIAAAREAGAGLISALVLDPGAAGPAAVLALWLESSLHGQPLSEMERLTLVSKASALTTGRTGEILPFFSRLYGRKITADVLDRLAALPCLDADVRLAVHEGRVSPGDLLQLEAHPGIDAQAAARLLAACGLSRSARREALRGMLAIADHGSDIFADFVSGYDPEKMPLDEAISGAAHPRMTSDLAALRRVAAQIELPPSASVKLPVNLEGGGFNVEIRVRGLEDLRLSLERLREATGNGTIGEMLKVLHGRD
jgi:hypothetical protein